MYDLVMSRSVARMAELAELTLPFVAVGGAAISAKGSGVEDELEESAWAAEVLGATPALSANVSVPGTAAADTIVYWMKISQTPAEYPRRNGAPHMRPLLSPAVSGRGNSGMAPAR